MPHVVQKPAERVRAADDSETALESLSSICTVLAVLLFVQGFIFQNFEIPSASMEKTLLIGDHVSQTWVSICASDSHWFPARPTTASPSAATLSSFSSRTPRRRTSTSSSA